MSAHALHGAEPADGTAGATVSAAAGHVVLVLAGAYWLARYGFDTPLLPVARAAGLGLFLATGGELVRRWSRPRAGQWFACESWAGLCPLLLAALFGAALPQAGWLLAALGPLSFAMALARAGLGRGRRLIWLSAALLMGCWFVGMAWGHGYANPLFVEGLATSALKKTTVDTLFHSTIASMVELHDVASTGLDGVVPLSYHVASHWLMAWLARLCGVAPFDFYQLGYPVAILPTLWAALLRLGLVLRDGGSNQRPGWRYWGLSVAGLVGVLPLETQHAFAIGWWRPVSESYGVSLIFAMSLLGSLVVCYRSLGPRVVTTRDRAQLAFLLLVLPVGVALTGLTKSSTAITLLAGGAFVLWRLRLYRDFWWLAAAVVGAGLTAVALSLVKIPGYARVSPLAFLRSFVHRDSLALWPLAYFCWLWALVVQRVRGVAPGMTLRSLLTSVRARELFDLELALFVAVIASLPDAILSIPGQSGGYFSDLHRWLALALLLGLSASHSPEAPRRELRERRLATLGGAAIGVALAGTVIGNTAILLTRAAQTNLAIRRGLMPNASRADLLGGSGALGRAALANPTLRLLQQVRAVATEPRDERRDAGLIAPAPPAALQTIYGTCELPFVWSALSGLPLIGGLPEQHCAYFGYWSYSDRPGGWEGPGPTLAGCRRADRLGLSSVVRVTDELGRPRVTREKCDAH